MIGVILLCPKNEVALKLEALLNNRTYVIEVREHDKHFEIFIQGPDGKQRVVAQILSRNQEHWTLRINGKISNILIGGTKNHLLVDWQNHTFPVEIYTYRERLHPDSARPTADSSGFLKAQMAGKIISVLVSEGDQVTAGQGMVVIEAMKMQNELRSPKLGTVMTCNVVDGQRVNAGDLLFEIKDTEGTE